MNLFFECETGAAGDMLASALVDLFENKEEITAELNALGLPHTEIKYGVKEQSGIPGTHLSVIVNGEEEGDDSHHHHHHHGRNTAEIEEIIDALNIDKKVANDVKAIYKIVAEAEAKAHGREVSEIHFHELGMLDAIADITMSAYLINKLSPEKILCSPINVGSGTVHCAHGVLPVPAPATANILTGVPYYKSEIKTELCTPTGAAVLKYFTDEFTAAPSLDRAQKIGVGAGTKELSQANILRAFLYSDDSITELSCNIDDMTGEEAGFAAEVMMSEGALDCFISPIIMKKGRPAYLFTVLCKNADEEKFARLIFLHTSSIGIRRYKPSRYTLEREFIETENAVIKRSEGFGTEKSKIEFDSLRALALEKKITLAQAREIIEKEL